MPLEAAIGIDEVIVASDVQAVLNGLQGADRATAIAALDRHPSFRALVGHHLAVHGKDD